MDSTTPAITLAAGALDKVSSLKRAVVPTDASDEALARTRRATMVLAREHGFEVVLYDRSHERWTDHPHPKGPQTVDEVDAQARPHLVTQMRDFEAAGVPVTAWLSTVPALTAILDVLQAMDIDAVMLPERLDDPKLMDRLQEGSNPAEIVDRIAALQLTTPPIVFSVPAEGPITITHYEEIS